MTKHINAGISICNQKNKKVESSISIYTQEKKSYDEDAYQVHTFWLYSNHKSPKNNIYFQTESIMKKQGWNSAYLTLTYRSLIFW